MDYIKTEIKTLIQITSGKQKAFYEHVLQTLKPVNLVSVYDVFTPEEIELIQYQVEPEIKQCYRNSFLTTLLFPDKVRYVEGKVNTPELPGLIIDHAFNRVGDSYIDITFELVLKEDITQCQYASIAEYDMPTLEDITSDMDYFGGVYIHEYIKNYGKH